ncbi:annexin B9-like [Ischnura elegans]|uniref:annexin B9-like n=1 Tax=Ischnura elegans TaxID=197161 RepID=UPI001ED8A84A|nr:annexin B9-like [Ischnura elegans]
MAIGWNVNPPPPHLADALQRSGTPNPTTGYPMPPQRTTNNPMPPHSSSQSSHPNTARMGQYRNSSRPSNNPTHWFCFTLCWMIIWLFFVSSVMYRSQNCAGQPSSDPTHLKYGICLPSATMGCNVTAPAPSCLANTFQPSAAPYTTTGYPMAPHPNASVSPSNSTISTSFLSNSNSSVGRTPQLSNCPPIRPPVQNSYPTQNISQGHLDHAKVHTLPSISPSVYPKVSVSPTPQHSSHGGGTANYGHQSVPQHPVKTNPTIVPAADFNPGADAEALRKAMEGLGTDEGAIIQVLAKKSNMQRQEIANQYKALYGKDLINDLNGELSGHFKNLVLACMTPPYLFYAKELHDAMSGLGTDEGCLIEILATLPPHDINMTRNTYKDMYLKDLEHDLAGETSGHFRILLLSLCQGHRDENLEVNPRIYRGDAALLQEGDMKWGTDESTFISILATRSFPHLNQLMVEYEHLSGHSLEKAIKKEFSGDIEEGLLAIVKSDANRPKFFAERLYKAMAGLGTKDGTLIRIIVTRSEVDLGDIKAEFHRAYGQTLEDFISGDTSGDYRKMLLAMIQ